jgi:hypothetical protein
LSLFNQAARHADVWGCGGVAPCILNFGIRWERWTNVHLNKERRTRTMARLIE